MIGDVEEADVLRSLLDFPDDTVMLRSTTIIDAGKVDYGNLVGTGLTRWLGGDIPINRTVCCSEFELHKFILLDSRVRHCNCHI